MLPALAANAGYSGSERYTASASATVPKTDLAGAIGTSYSTSRERDVNSQDIGFTWNALDFGLSFIRAGQEANRYLITEEMERKAEHNIVRDVIHPAGTKLFGQVDIETEIDLTGLDVEALITSDLIGGKFGISSIGPNTTFGTISITTDVIPVSIAANTNVGILEAGDQTDVYLSANGFIFISNNNVITTYLGLPITSFLSNPVIYGTPFTVIGDGNTDFRTILTGGSEVEIQDIVPGTSGNTSYIVNTVFSNTAFTINTAFAGGNMSNGIFKYTYNGNI